MVNSDMTGQRKNVIQRYYVLFILLLSEYIEYIILDGIALDGIAFSWPFFSFLLILYLK